VLNAFLFVEHGDTYWKKLLIEQREQMQGVNTTPDLIGKKAGKDLHRQLLRSSKCTVIFWQVEPVMDLLLAIHKKRQLSPRARDPIYRNLQLASRGGTDGPCAASMNYRKAQSDADSCPYKPSPWHSIHNPVETSQLKPYCTS
jgi:hypothetical protein